MDEAIQSFAWNCLADGRKTQRKSYSPYIFILQHCLILLKCSTSSSSNSNSEKLEVEAVSG